MLNLYLEPEDLINLLAEDESLSQEQHYFQTNYYKGILNLRKKQESCLALAALSALTGNYTESILHLSLLKDFESPLIDHLFHFLWGIVKEKLNQFENSQSFLLQAKESLSLIKLKKPFLIDLCLFNSFFINRNYSKALEMNLKIWELPENIKQVYFLKHAYCNEILGLYDEALNNHSKAANCEGELTQVSNIWLKSLKGEDVSEDFESILIQEPESKVKNDLVLLYSLLLIKSENYQKAKDLMEGLDQVDLRPEIYSALSFVYYKTDQIVKAFIFTLKYIKLLPTLPDGWINLSILYQKTQQDHRLKCLEKAKKLMKDEWFSKTYLELSDMILCYFDISQLGKDFRCSAKGPVKIKDFEQRMNYDRIGMEISERQLFYSSFSDNEEGVQQDDLNFRQLESRECNENHRERIEFCDKRNEDQNEANPQGGGRTGRNYSKPRIETLFVVPQKRNKEGRRGI